MEKRYAGPRAVSIIGVKSGVRDLTENSEWGYLAGLEGEKKEAYTEQGSKKVKWEKNGERKPLTWYKTYFETPEGENTVAIRMNGMGKGLIWVNGNGVGRYWMSFLSPLGKSTQTEYYIPRSFMKEKKKKNMVVIFEEEPGVKLEAIDFVLVNRDTICSYVGEDYPISVKSWKRQGPNIASRSKDMRLKAVMKCPPEKQMVAVEFKCLGKNYCSVVVEGETFGGKGCPEIVKTLAVQVKCEKKEGKEVDGEEKE